eukprot:TRINITY_DN4041_c0_g1_i1.p1 TRINITY_DN4041_c0_g1~~TRINITY_DN4041_c0_g1_i1.p1  ORF type:complete len:256 (-),score=66.07 TRINITY_DN4041_c0_g1_i1:51-818(-)
MARNEEKANSMLSRYLQWKKEEEGIDTRPQKRPYLASLCEDLTEATRWRGQIIREISKKVAEIQNDALGEHKIRDLNDEINKLFREKGHWEKHIMKLGGRRFAKDSLAEDEGVLPTGGGRYRYFGAAKNLEGVKELFAPIPQEKAKRTRAELYSGIDADYYGYRDDDDGVLAKAEKKAERKAAKESEANWQTLKKQRMSQGIVEDGDSSSDEEGNGRSDDFVAHVVVPSKEDMEKLLLERRKQDLLNKYVDKSNQ